jgi:hypothetical protein
MQMLVRSPGLRRILTGVQQEFAFSGNRSLFGQRLIFEELTFLNDIQCKYNIFTNSCLSDIILSQDVKEIPPMLPESAISGAR